MVHHLSLGNAGYRLGYRCAPARTERLSLCTVKRNSRSSENRILTDVLEQQGGRPSHPRTDNEEPCCDLGDRLRNVRFDLAGSTGRRNTGVKSLCRGFKLQGLTWSFVELTSHFVQMGLRMHRQVGALRKYCLSRPLVFSFDPRCHGLCGSQK